MTIIREIPLGDNHVWVMIGDRVSVVRQDFKRPGKDGRLCKYKAICIGADSFPEARKIVARLLPHIPPIRVQTRLAERVLDWQLEVKASGDFDWCWIEWVADNVDSVLDGSLPLSLEDREALASTSLVSPILD